MFTCSTFYRLVHVFCWNKWGICRGREKWSVSTFYWLVHVKVLEQVRCTKQSPVYWEMQRLKDIHKTFHNPHSLRFVHRSPMGIVEPGPVSVHPMRRNPPQLGGPHIQSQVRQSRLLDASAGRGKWLRYYITKKARSIVHSFAIYTVWGIRLWKRFCKMFSESSPCLLGQHGSCITAQRPVELSENILQNFFQNLTPQTVCAFGSTEKEE